MKVNKAKILIIDDEDAIAEILSDSLTDEGYEVQTASNGTDGLNKISEFSPDVVLLDIWMPGEIDGIEVLNRAKPKYPSVEFIMMSGHGTIETAVKATKLGAWDFVEKPLSMDKISILISNILTYQIEKGEKIALLNKLRKSIALVGNSAPMMTLKRMISRVAPSSSWVLIAGENGTGKQLVAQNIHYLSERASRPFVELNCAAVPEDLLEAELFGFEKEAFVGVEKAQKGKFDHAQTGTLFLDEIGMISLDLQEKLLEVLRDGVYQRVSGEEKIHADVRVIAATTHDLEKMVEAGTFREDLYVRLNVIPFAVPTLGERREDIPVLMNHFSEQFAREGGYVKKMFSERSFEKLMSYSWPGNVRELRNFIERVYILTPGEYVDLHDLHFAGLPMAGSGPMMSDEVSFRQARADFEKDFLLKKITENGGNISKTAELIGLERSYLHRKIKTYGIDI